MNSIRTIAHDLNEEIIIEKSKFIAYLKRVKDIQEANDFILELKKRHYQANHVCHALKIYNHIRSSDDGEPSGTAGIPMLNLLMHEELNEVVAVVVRYFGGVKLGTGGLARAYRDSVAEAIKIAEFLIVEEQLELKVSVDYKEANIIMSKYEDVITNKVFAERVDIYFSIPPESEFEYRKELNDLTNGNCSIEELGLHPVERKEKA